MLEAMASRLLTSLDQSGLRVHFNRNFQQHLYQSDIIARLSHFPRIRSLAPKMRCVQSNLLFRKHNR